jgi:Secretion system C-terminal sorting domain
LKIFFTILIFIVAFSFSANAQQKLPSANEPVIKLIKFYPNPAPSIVFFEFVKSYDKSTQFQVYNLMGKKVFELKNTPSKFSIPLTDFFRGIYVYQLRDKNSILIECGKFQVIK